MSSRNRTAGNNYERELVTRYNSFGFIEGEEDLVPLFPPVGTTRNLSTYMDSQKVDIITVDDTRLKEFGLLIQAKNTTSAVSYPKLLSLMKEVSDKKECIPVIYHKQTSRKEGTERFMKRGEYVIMNASDFEKIYTDLTNHKQVLEEVLTYFDSFSDETQLELNKFLTLHNM